MPILRYERFLAALLAAALAGPPVPAAGQTPSLGAGLRIQVREGEGAINNIRAQRAKEPVVVVTDASGQPVAGAQVTFLLPDLGASAMFPASGSTLTVTTGADGVAVGRNMRPNNVVGEFEIRVAASYQGQTARAVIPQANAAPPAGAGAGKKTALIVALVGGAGAAVAIGVTRGGNKSAAPAGTSISAGGSTFGPPR